MAQGHDLAAKHKSWTSYPILRFPVHFKRSMLTEYAEYSVLGQPRKHATSNFNDLQVTEPITPFLTNKPRYYISS